MPSKNLGSKNNRVAPLSAIPPSNSKPSMMYSFHCSMCGGKVEPVTCPAPWATTTSPYRSQTGSRGAAQSRRTKSPFQAHVLRTLPQGKLQMSLRIPGATYVWGETRGLLGFYGEKPRAVQSGKMCSHCADKERPSACGTELFLEARAPYWKAPMGERVRGRLGKTAG